MGLCSLKPTAIITTHCTAFMHIPALSWKIGCAYLESAGLVKATGMKTVLHFLT